MNSESEYEEFYRQCWPKTAKNPEAWLCYAERLKHAADVLRDNCWPRNRAYNVHDAAVGDHCYGPVYMLISGFAMEGLIKGIMIAVNPNLVEQQRLSKKMLGHDLIELFKGTRIRGHKNDTDLLLRLQNYIENFGRYPVTKLKQDMAKRGRTHFCSVDFGKVDRFWGRLLEHYNTKHVAKKEKHE